MTSGQAGWLLLLLLALFLIIIGIQGNLGTTIAILFAPKHVSIAGE